MLPVTAWPPGPPGSPLSPFGAPRCVDLARHPNGYSLPKGAWIVQTGPANKVIMFRPPVSSYGQPTRQMGTGFLPGATPPAGPTPPTHDQQLEAWRAWQRSTGRNDGPIWPPPGRSPPNFAGWTYVPAPFAVLVPPNSGGTVLADGQNTVVWGTGTTSIIEAFSV